MLIFSNSNIPLIIFLTLSNWYWSLRRIILIKGLSKIFIVSKVCFDNPLKQVWMNYRENSLFSNEIWANMSEIAFLVSLNSHWSQSNGLSWAIIIVSSKSSSLKLIESFCKGLGPESFTNWHDRANIETVYQRNMKGEVASYIIFFLSNTLILNSFFSRLLCI